MSYSKIIETMYEPIPEEILGGPTPSKEFAEEILERVVRCTVPSSDQRNLKADLKWQFLINHDIEKPGRRNFKRPFLTRSERKKFGLSKLPRDGWNYKDLEKMRNMWKEYMTQNIKLETAPSVADPEWVRQTIALIKSELVGAEVKMTKTKNPSLIGVYGTIVLETRCTFQIVTPDNKLKILMKDTSYFEIVLDNLRFTFNGSNLINKPSDRSKKFKSRLYFDL